MTVAVIKRNPFAGQQVITDFHIHEPTGVNWASNSPSTQPKKAEEFYGFKYGEDTIVLDLALNQVLTASSTEPLKPFEYDNEWKYYVTLNPIKHLGSDEYLDSWKDYVSKLKNNLSLKSETIDTVNGLVLALNRLYSSSFQLPISYPLEDGELELRWESEKDSLIIQIDEDGELTFVVRDKIEKRDLGFDCLKVEEFLSVDLNSLFHRRLSCIEK